MWNTENPDWEPHESVIIFTLFNRTIIDVIDDFEYGEELQVILDELKHTRDLVSCYFLDLKNEPLTEAWNQLEASIIDFEKFLPTVLYLWDPKDLRAVEQTFKEKKGVFLKNSDRVKTLLTEINL